MRRNVVLAHIIELHILIKPRQLCRKNVSPKISVGCAIYHRSKHFCACVGACVCNCMPFLKEPVFSGCLILPDRKKTKFGCSI